MDREQIVKLLRDIQNSPGFYNDITKKALTKLTK